MKKYSGQIKREQQIVIQPSRNIKNKTGLRSEYQGELVQTLQQINMEVTKANGKGLKKNPADNLKKRKKHQAELKPGRVKVREV